MRRSLAELLLELREYGARVYRIDDQNYFIQVGNRETREMAVALLEQRCHIATRIEDGNKILIIKENDYD